MKERLCRKVSSTYPDSYRDIFREFNSMFSSASSKLQVQK
jgi:hypothetical protein